MPLSSHICLTNLEVLLCTSAQRLHFIKSPFIKPQGQASAKAHWDIEVILQEEERKDYQRLREEPGVVSGVMLCFNRGEMEKATFPNGTAYFSVQYHWDIWCSLLSVQAILQKVNPNYLTFFFLKLSMADTRRCQLCFSPSANGSQNVFVLVWVCDTVCVCAFVLFGSLCVCVCVLVGRMSIPSVTVAVPSFHAPAAPCESSSLGSLSVLFNERASHQNAG